MPLRSAVRMLAAAGAIAVLLAACAEPAPPPPAPPPPPPPPPAVALSPKLVELASAYRHYMVAATGITPTFEDGAGVAKSLNLGAAYEPGQLLRGAMAYGAVVALQDKAFVDAVRVYVKDPAQRTQIAYEILKNPAYVLGIPGSDEAAGLVVAAVGGDAQRLYDEGKAVKQAAYDIQKAPWSHGEVAGRDARLAEAKDESAAPMLGDMAETTRLEQASAGASPLAVSAQPLPPPYTPTVTRALAIAALAALGQAGDENVDQILGLMNEPNVGLCMSQSKLNLYQCLAVARPHYEDVFCLGQHAMMDTGRCLIKATGLPEPYEPRFVPGADSIAKKMPVKKPPAKKRVKARKKG